MLDTSRLVPWNKLVPSKRNVRKVKADPTQLAANIEADGLIHPLVVIEREGGRYEVAAGERRRRAIGLLIKAGKWERTALVAVEVRAEDQATALSLAENVQRVAMHPADAFRAFGALAADGHDEAAIANRYGYDAAEVRRLLTLGQLSPRVLNALAADKIDVETARAFTLTNDHARQDAVLARHKSAREVRAMLTDTKVGTGSRGFLFVADAYRDHGGTITTDLFATDGEGYADNAALVAELVQERFDSLAHDMRGRGWGEVHAGEREPNERYQWHHVHAATCRELTPEEVQLIDELEAAIAARRAEIGKDVWRDAVIDAHERAIRKVQRARDIYSPEQMKSATLVLALDSAGGIETTVYTKRIARTGAIGGTKSTGGDRSLIDAKMTEDLSRVRTAALQYEVANNDALARDVLLDRLLSTVTATYAPPHAVQLRAGERLLTERSFGIAMGEIASPASRVADTLATMPADEGARFAWLRALDDDSKTRLLSYCTAALLDATERKFPEHTRLASAERIATAAALDMAQHWQPTDEFWNRLSKRALLAALTETLGAAAASTWAGSKRSEIAAVCATRVAGSGWLPPSLRPRPQLEASAVQERRAWVGDNGDEDGGSGHGDADAEGWGEREQEGGEDRRTDWTDADAYALAEAA